MSLLNICWVPRPELSIQGRRGPWHPGLKTLWGISFLPEGVSEQDGGSTLQRVAVTREDSGTYICWAENRVGRVQAVSFVHVKGRV